MMNTTNTITGQEFFFSGFRLSSREAQAMLRNIPSPILAAGADAEANLIHLFDSEEAFESWARHTAFATQFMNVNSMVRTAKADFEQGVKILSSTDLRAQFAAPEPQASLFEEDSMRGRVHSLGAGIYPDLLGIGLARRIGSAAVSGLCMIAERQNFGGAKLYLLGAPTLEVADLNALGLSQYAGSAIIL